MEQNHKAFAPEAATDEPASIVNQSPDAPVFATEAERVAYERGLADRHAAPPGPMPPDAFDFDPVETRYRQDGITPEKQREYIEALADTGIARTAAARIGVTEQSVSRFRRRADAASFDLACEAARRFGARRIRDTAWERAIEGTIRGHYYHGELKSEERVYDNRLLVYLLGKTGHLLDEPEEAPAIAANWEPWVEAIEQGTPAPDLNPPAPEPEPEDLESKPCGSESCDKVWQNMDGTWWTSFPPPAGFFGVEEGQHGDWQYRRHLSDAEQAMVDAEYGEDDAEAIDARDDFFGFAGGRAGEEDFSAMEAEPYEPYEPSTPADRFMLPSETAMKDAP